MSLLVHTQQLPLQQEQPKKRTRRRLRVSCVECTRRRQKCDRQQPCGLCKTRGVEHLCRWETEPYARPPPARPPGRAATRKEKPANVITNWQINGNNAGGTTSGTAPTSGIIHYSTSPTCQALMPWRGGSSVPSPASSVASPASTFSSTSLSPLEGEPSMMDGLKEAALALARMSLSEEDHCLEGPLAYTLQELTGTMPLRTFEFPLQTYPQSIPRIRSNEPFVPRLPDKAHCIELLRSYDEHVNWSIGIPQNVLFSSHEKMWQELTIDPTCLQRFNPNWIALLFAMFAFSPACVTEEESRDYFNQALAARKLEEDRSCSLDSPASSGDLRGAVYTCLATAFLARYLQDRGRVTEAWRVVGSGLRDAQNAGLHRVLAPGKAKHLTNDERTFMIVAWHLCVEFDRYLSLFLGRSTVVRARDCNVQLPPVTSDALALNGSTNTALLFQYYFISMTKTVSEAKERFLSEIPELEDGHAYFDARLAEWLASLPSFYKLDQPHDTSYNHIYPKLHLQRMTLNSYYTASCLFFHRSLAYRKPSKEAGATSYPGKEHPAWDQSQLAQYAINVLHAQCQLMLNQWWERQVPFDISMYMFEAAVTLGVTLLRYPYHPLAEEWRRELAEAIAVFEKLRARDFGKIVGQAIQVLQVLRDLSNDAKTKHGHAQKTDAGHAHHANFHHGQQQPHYRHSESTTGRTTVQEEAKPFYNFGEHDLSQSQTNSDPSVHLNGNGYANVNGHGHGYTSGQAYVPHMTGNGNVHGNSYESAANTADMFGNVWMEHGAPAYDVGSTFPTTAGAGPDVGAAPDPAILGVGVDPLNDYQYVNDLNEGVDFSAYATWTTDADGFMMPTLGPEANINAHYL